MKLKPKIVFNAPVTLSFVLACFIATLLGYISHGSSNTLLFSVYHSSLSNPLTFLRFFTHVLGHSGWEHFIGNATYLLLLGPSLEEKYGSKVILEVIGITAIVTGVVNYLCFWNVALCGASGVVFALILLISFTGFRRGEIPFSFICVVVIFLGQQVYEGIFVKDNISNIAHIVGGIIGAFSGYFLNRKP